MKLYGTYRPVYTNKGVRYTPSYFLDKQYEDYLKAGLTSTKDLEIPEDRYTAEIAPGIKKQTKFIIGEYNETYVNVDDYKANIQNVGAQFQIDIFNTTEEARQWVRDNTDLVELSPGTFEIYPETTDEIIGELIPQKIITID